MDVLIGDEKFVIGEILYWHTCMLVSMVCPPLFEFLPACSLVALTANLADDLVVIRDVDSVPVPFEGFADFFWVGRLERIESG